MEGGVNAEWADASSEGDHETLSHVYTHTGSCTPRL